MIIYILLSVLLLILSVIVDRKETRLRQFLKDFLYGVSCMLIFMCIEIYICRDKAILINDWKKADISIIDIDSISTCDTICKQIQEN